MENFHQLDNLLKTQAPAPSGNLPDAYLYAACMAAIENVVAVVSDLSCGTSRIFCGNFAKALGIENYSSENSIWEKKILSLMPESEQKDKIISELRFFHFLRHHPKSKNNYYLLSKLRIFGSKGELRDILHRMYYIFDGSAVRYAICLYGPLSIDFKGKSIVVDSTNGASEELTSMSDSGILSSRERQVLVLINSGLKSADIALRLNISKHTVSRHRQGILAKLQVRNSIEACRLARSMQII